MRLASIKSQKCMLVAYNWFVRKHSVNHWEGPLATKTANSCIEVIFDAEVDLDLNALEANLEAGNYNQLPTPLCPAVNTDVPMHMNLNLSKGSQEGTYNVVKYYTFLQPERRDVVEEQLATGTLMRIVWVPDRCNTKKSLQYLFERLFLVCIQTRTFAFATR